MAKEMIEYEIVRDNSTCGATHVYIFFNGKELSFYEATRHMTGLEGNLFESGPTVLFRWPICNPNKVSEKPFEITFDVIDWSDDDMTVILQKLSRRVDRARMELKKRSGDVGVLALYPLVF